VSAQVGELTGCPDKEQLVSFVEKSDPETLIVAPNEPELESKVMDGLEVIVSLELVWLIVADELVDDVECDVVVRVDFVRLVVTELVVTLPVSLVLVPVDDSELVDVELEEPVWVAVVLSPVDDPEVIVEVVVFLSGATLAGFGELSP